jgi:hypothetical protein
MQLSYVYKSEKRCNFDVALANLDNCDVQFKKSIWFGQDAANEGFSIVYRNVPMTILSSKRYPTVEDYEEQLILALKAINAELKSYHESGGF